MKTQTILLMLLAAGTAMAQQECEEQRQPPTAADFIARLDADGDGQVSQSEFDGPAEHFSRFDVNSDGYISADEAPTGPPTDRKRGPKDRHGNSEGPQPGQPPMEDGEQPAPPTEGACSLIAQMDQDGDGLISAEEFAGPAEHFQQLDQDGDGYISEDEAPQHPPHRGRRGPGGPEAEETSPEN